jgi:hypothetical protein
LIVSISELSNLYFSVGDDYFKNNKFTYSSLAKKYIFNGLLMDLASDDLVKAKNNLIKYSNTYCMLSNSREDIFISSVFDAVETNDSEKISIISAEYNNVSMLSNLQVKLLLKIKANIDGFGNMDLVDDDNMDDKMDDVMDNYDLC